MCEEFNTSCAYVVSEINNEPKIRITIGDLLNDKKLRRQIRSGTKHLVCKNGHMLIKYESKIRKNHFRHKNSSDVGGHSMTEWHSEWESNFQETEVPFPCKKHGISDRRADAVIGDNVLEFQHSYISKDEVDCRNYDYCVCHRKELSWIIDCNDTIVFDKLSSKRYLIKFIKDYWKYENFICNEYIYLSIGNLIFRIDPNKVKSHMIDVRECKSKETFIQSLIDNNNQWDDRELIQCTLYHNQRGAGCGKTYESIQLVNNDKRFSNKATFIYLTKVHSAKDVIYKEFKEQYDDGKLDNIKEIGDRKDNAIGKQYKIIIEKNKKQRTIIIGTIDSLTYRIGTPNTKYSDHFRGIVNSIKNGHTNIPKDGRIKYAGQNVGLNKECLLIIDEAQDLDPVYIEAVCMIMRKTYTDAYIIGDKLQSIWGEHNIHTFLEKNGIPNTKIIKTEGINCVRRFHNIQFKDFVNQVIDFDKYTLPPINSICDGNCKYTHDDVNCPYTLFETQPIYSDDSDYDKVNKELDKIIQYMEDEIAEHNYQPHNFMFIFPILSKNHLANQLEERLQVFWIHKFNDNTYLDKIKKSYWKNKVAKNKYNKYVYLHRSDGNKPINLVESENSTRILSIHASKGNGCEVVFLLGVTELALKLCSKQTGNLVYDSLLHVAITRQKKSLYIGLSNSYDDISQRFYKFDKTYDPKIQPHLYFPKYTQLPNIISYVVDDPESFSLFHDEYIESQKYRKKIPEACNDKKLIDWGHHLIRYCVMKYYILANFHNSEKMSSSDNMYMNQYIEISRKISKLSVKNYEYLDYNNILTLVADNHKGGDKIEKLRKKYPKYAGDDYGEFPILIFQKSDRSIYHEYYTIITSYIEHIQKKIKKAFRRKHMPILCPLEVILFTHVVGVMDNGKYTDIHIMEIYSILYCYEKCYNTTHDKFKCLCNNTFKDNNTNIHDRYLDIQASINNHYENTQIVLKTYKNITKYITKHVDEKFVYHIDHRIDFNGKNDNFTIWYKYDIVAFSDNYVIDYIIRPQLNTVNFNQIISECIFRNYIISNCKQENNKKRYQGKTILTCIITLDSEKPVFYKINIQNTNIINQLIAKYLFERHSRDHNNVIRFYNFCKLTKPGHRNSIEYTREKLEKLDIPLYYKRFFDQIEFDISRSEADRNEILEKVNNQDIFLKELDSYLHTYIDEYINGKKDGCDY